MVETEAHDLGGSAYALSLEHLQKHNVQPAGYAMARCKAALSTSTFVVSTHNAKGAVALTEDASSLFLQNPALLQAVHRLAWQADGHKWRLDGCWSLDDEDMQQQLDWQEMAGGGKVFTALLPQGTRLHQWIAAQLQPPAGSSDHGITLSRVEVVKSATTIAGFHYRVQQTAARLTGNGGNNPFVRTWPGDAVKTAMLRHLESQFAAAERDGVRVLPLWHGCSAAVADEIVTKGIANVAERPALLYGSGIYLTPQPEYAAGYASGVIKSPSQHEEASEFVLLLCAVCVGSAYPITRAADYRVSVPCDRHNGQGDVHCKQCKTFCAFQNCFLHPGCDAHHVLMDIHTGWHAAKATAPLCHHFEEVVVAHDSQVLPIAKVTVKVDKMQLGTYFSSCPLRPLQNLSSSTASHSS